MKLDEAISKRFSCRKFTSKKPDYRRIIEAIESASKAPMAGNLFTLKFILVSDKEKIEKLAEACQQSFVSKVHYILAVCSDSKQCVASYNDRGEIYARQQAGAAIENLLLKLTDLGLAGCWVGAFAPESVKRVLQLPEGIETEALIPIGYPIEKSRQRTKPDIDSLVYFDFWKNKTMTPIRKVEAE